LGLHLVTVDDAVATKEGTDGIPAFHDVLTLRLCFGNDLDGAVPAWISRLSVTLRHEAHSKAPGRQPSLVRLDGPELVISGLVSPGGPLSLQLG
jgi:hypothetical protein